MNDNEIVGYTEFRYSRDQVQMLCEMLQYNRYRLSRALMAAEDGEIFPRGTDFYLILELLERLKEHLEGTRPDKIFQEWGIGQP